MFEAIRRLFGGSAEPGAAAAAESIDYKGFQIIPEPQRHGGNYLTAGRILLDGPSGRREHRFVRADTHSSAEDAREFTILKAQRLIDEQGERLFGA